MNESPFPLPHGLTRRTAVASALCLPMLAHARQPRPIPKVVGVFGLPFDHLWVSRLHMPLQQAHALGEIEYRAFENIPAGGYADLLRQEAKAGCDLIFGESNASNAAALAVAKAFPAVNFVWWSLGAPQSPNFSVYQNCIVEPMYLAGMLAASLSPNRHLGLVGGFAMRHTLAMMQAFALGAQAIDPKIRISSGVVNHWYHAVRGARMAERMLAQGADTLLALTHAGVVETAVEHKAIAFSCMANQQQLLPNTVAAAVLWHPEAMIKTVIERTRQKTLKAENFADHTSMRLGGSSLSPLLPHFAARVPKAVLAQVEDCKQRILSGTFVVPRIEHMTLNTHL